MQISAALLLFTISAAAWTLSGCSAQHEEGSDSIIVRNEVLVNATCPSGNLLIYVPEHQSMLGEFFQGKRTDDPEHSWTNIQLSIAVSATPQKKLFQFNETCDIIATIGQRGGIYRLQNLPQTWTNVQLYGSGNGYFLDWVALGLMSPVIQDSFLPGELNDWKFPYALSFGGNDGANYSIKLSGVGFPDNIVWEEHGAIYVDRHRMTGQ